MASAYRTQKSGFMLDVELICSSSCYSFNSANKPEMWEPISLFTVFFIKNETLLLAINCKLDIRISLNMPLYVGLLLICISIIFLTSCALIEGYNDVMPKLASIVLTSILFKNSFLLIICLVDVIVYFVWGSIISPKYFSLFGVFDDLDDADTLSCLPLIT